MTLPWIKEDNIVCEVLTPSSYSSRVLMTTIREEDRQKCIEAIQSEIISAIIDEGGTIDIRMEPVAARAFDSLHGVARVIPIDAVGDLTNPPIDREGAHK